MSELKAYKGDVYIPVYGSIADAQVYLKSEVDKEIADLIEKNKRLANKDMIMASETIKGMFDALRHNNYKRCLAMAELCDAEADVADADGDYEDMRRFQKWHKRWLELAKKFKEGK